MPGPAKAGTGQPHTKLKLLKFIRANLAAA